MVINDIRLDKNCRLCGSERIHPVFELKPIPPGDMFLPKSELGRSSRKYPLVLALCGDCGYVHLPYVLNPEISYSNYLYETKVTVGLNQHYKEYAEDLVSSFMIPAGSLVVDLGSNDGTILRTFKECGMEVFGVEPSEQVAVLANEQVPTINDYFHGGVADKILSEYRKPSIVTCNYTYANIDDVVEFTRNVRRILDDDGLFVMQTGYHPAQMKIRMFDYIYHEHLSYFTVKVLRRLFDQCGLELIHVEKKDIRGGSIRTIAQCEGGKRAVVGHTVEAFIEEEEGAGIHEREVYFRFAEDVDYAKWQLLEFINMIRSKNQRIVGYGASDNTTTLMHHFEMGDHLEYIVDDNSIKHGLYSPGYHLPVYPSQKLYEDRPEYVIVLAWQHQGSIVERNREYIDRIGKFIVPLPELRVV